MAKYVCSVCGYEYDEAAGIPEAGIAPGTKWEDLPEDWLCPMCGASKGDFDKEADEEPAVVPAVTAEMEEHMEEDMRELSIGELSALCSNLAKACSKQYLPEESALFEQLSSYYERKVAPAEKAQIADLLTLIRKDLDAGYPAANQVSVNEADRGALRALTWGEKVTRMLNSLMERYEDKKSALLENTNVFVCEICGFIFIGDEPPDVCPVCKVPKQKIHQVKRG